jgi:lipid A 3-O-deacylase
MMRAALGVKVKSIGLCFFLLFVSDRACRGSDPESADLDTKVSLDGPWLGETGGGFRNGARALEFSVGTGIGLRDLAGEVNHDMAIGMVRYGWIMSDLLGDSHWYRGNLEFVPEFFLGAQYRPHGAYVVGATPLFRYNFVSDTPWVPFAEAGLGPTLTDIGEPDLSSTFEFNIQAGVGTHYFWKPRQAITLQARFFHLSNAGIKRPNMGLNTGFLMIGISSFF